MADGAAERAAAAPGRDLTSGPITRTLLLFALPTLGSSVLQSLNASINSIWVGRFLGEGALAATSNANLIMFLMFSAVFGFGMAATILVAQNIGRRDVDGARRAFGSAAGLLLVGSTLVALLGWLFAPDILRLLETPAAAQPLALAYLRVIFLSVPGSFMTVLLSMALRGAGDAVTPLWAMAFSAAIDVVMNPVLILGLGPAPALGIAGSATATVIATYVGLAAMLSAIYWRDLPIRLRGREWRYLVPEGALARVIGAKGLPLGLQMIVVSVSSLAMMGLINREGLETTAAYGVALQLWTYIQMPALAIGAAVSAMAAQNIGANRWDRVDRIARSGILINVALTGGLVLLLWLVDRPALGLFLPAGSAAIPIAIHIHNVAGWSFVLFGVMMILFSVVRANGAVIAPLLIIAVALLPVRIGFAALLRPEWGADAIWWSFPVGSAVATGLAWLNYRFGSWRGEALVGSIGAVEATERSLADGEACGRQSPTG